MPAVAVPAFALAWWAACYLIGRDPARGPSVRTAAALAAYAIGVLLWTLEPGSALAEIFLCVPALFWAGAAVALLPPRLVPERRQIDLGWLILVAPFLLMAVALPAAGRLVVLAPLAGGVVLLWRFRDQVQPIILPAALAVVAALYAAGLAMLLIVDLGAPDLVILALGVDLLMLAFLVVIAEALEVGERLRPDLIRSLIAALLGVAVVGVPVTLTMLASTSSTVRVLQFALLAAVMTGIGLIGQLRRALDKIAFRHDDRLREDRGALLLLAEALPRHRQRHRLIATGQPDFLRFTRQALDNYGRLGRLMRSPLTDLPAVDRRLSGLTIEQPLARAMELRAVLQESVDRLRPAGRFATSDEWRHYNALYFGVVLGLDPYARRRSTDGLDREARLALDWMRRNVPRQTLRRWKDEGASIVARRLWDDMTHTDPRWLTRVTTRST